MITIYLPKDQALAKLQAARSEVDNLKADGDPHNPRFIEWQRNTRVTISAIFGQQAQHLPEWTSISFTPYGAVNPRTVLQAFARGMEEARSLLQSMLQEVEEYGEYASDTERLPPRLSYEALDCVFVRGSAERSVVEQDYRDAQQAAGAGLYKAAALHAGGVIEGMLLDALQWPEIVSDAAYPQAIKRLQRDGRINWDRATLMQLAETAMDLKLLSLAGKNMASSLTDFRDTVHPKAEVRIGRRATRQDVDVLMAMVRWIHAELTGKAPGQATRPM